MSPLEESIRAIVAEELHRALTPESSASTKRRNGLAAPREVITADEVAALLGVDRKTVYEHAALGTIPCRRLGKRFLFPRVEVMQWLAPCRGSIGESR